ncbi:residue succinyltransferase component of 2-oxoglutarate dehydrogenase complex, mitochondrial [Seminavis robusta]|uniref:dihydrolipoyllysine-residue succinyltransferase n=1 Tax=Seminavis robusta TaxID=568900 RepID=A0A9N8EMJ7_9STRA|nr:residue succinyltransferase component of 2-oxoglutarate dehydrogenase complex, mitochondrial [Seminavis robusta]|eukprot:Sro1221_g253630.1 residue succinyltransferase component of 2-oxoglutarate dehydrogenase complex, mitochondrial (453) ;mRNA; f:5226-6798
MQSRPLISVVARRSRALLGQAGSRSRNLSGSTISKPVGSLWVSNTGHDNSVVPTKIPIIRGISTATGVCWMPIKTIEVPTMGDSITEGTVVDLPVAPGDTVQADDVVVVLETDKVSVDVRAPEAGALVEILAEVDDVVEVGASLFRLDTDVEVAAKPAAAAAPESTPEPAAPAKEEPAAAAAPPPPPPPAAAPPTPPPPQLKPSGPPIADAPAFTGSRTERRTKMSRMRQRVAARLKEAQNTAAMLTTFQECDMGNFMELRNRHKDEFEKKHGVKLGFMSVFVTAATAALQELPAVNAYIDDAAKEVVYREFVDISVAVASPTGLVVPVLRNTETMNFADVERNIAMYAQKAREGTLALDDMAGGTFTISNGGVFGSLMGTPIINPPQSAILGMHATKMRAVVNEKGEVVARPMMYLALTYDHRLIDGREGVTFLKSIADKISDPSRLILDL